MATDPLWVFENYGEAAELIDELEAEIARLKPDAERLYWLRDHYHGFAHYRAMKHRPNALILEIDAERARVKP